MFFAVGMTLLLFLIFLFPPRVTRSGDPQTERYVCIENLRQIHLALLEYHDEHFRFPPAFVRGPDGKPWHSWRVLILPYLKQQNLHSEYRFDEPWDGPHNRKLLARRPKVFQSELAHGKIPPDETSYLAVVGPKAAWLGAEATKWKSFPNGIANVVFLVEAKDAGVPWLAPDDLSFEEACAVPTGLSGRRPSSFHANASHGIVGGSHVLFGMGEVRFIPQFVQSDKNIDAEIWQAMLTRERDETAPMKESSGP
jgi:hypothetical protein